MFRRIWPAALLIGAVIGLSIDVGDISAQAPKETSKDAKLPAGPTADFNPKEMTARQRQLETQYKSFITNLLALAQKFEKSDKVEDKDKAKALRKAIEIADKEGVDNKFTVLIRTLSKNSDLGVIDLTNASTQNQELAKILREMLNILTQDDELAKILEEKARLEKLLAELNTLIRVNKTIQARTDSNKGDPKQISKDQKSAAEKTAQLADKMGAKKDPKDGKGKDGPPKDGKGEPKDGKGEPKDGKGGPPKDGPPKDGKGGPPKDGGSGEPKDGPPPPPKPEAPGAEKVKSAVPDEDNAAKSLDENKRQPASDDQSKAIDKLQQAREDLEKRLKQLREQELEKLLANLEARVNKMLQMQIEVLAATTSIDAQVLKNPDKKPAKPDFQNAQKQEDKEAEIIGEADKAIALLKNEGSAVAFPAVFEEVRQDMMRVKERLHDANVGADTQAIEKDIIEILTQMRDALKKAQQELGKSPPPPPPGGPPPDQPQLQKLLDEIAELKMIKQLQIQVNNRTSMYGKKAPGEQSEDPQTVKEVKDLAARQQKLETMVYDLVTGKNK
jgi:hypothetical protein